MKVPANEERSNKSRNWVGKTNGGVYRVSRLQRFGRKMFFFFFIKTVLFLSELYVEYLHLMIVLTHLWKSYSDPTSVNCLQTLTENVILRLDIGAILFSWWTINTGKDLKVLSIIPASLTCCSPPPRGGGQAGGVPSVQILKGIAEVNYGAWTKMLRT